MLYGLFVCFAIMFLFWLDKVALVSVWVGLDVVVLLLEFVCFGLLFVGVIVVNSVVVNQVNLFCIFWLVYDCFICVFILLFGFDLLYYGCFLVFICLVIVGFYCIWWLVLYCWVILVLFGICELSSCLLFSYFVLLGLGWCCYNLITCWFVVYWL